MNSLSLGFLYVTGLSWLLCETCISASNGNWLPLTAFLIFFTLMFAILGCLPISSKAVDAAGPIFAIIMGVWILGYGFAAGSGVLSVGIRVVGGAVVAAFGLLAILAQKGEEAGESH